MVRFYSHYLGFNNISASFGGNQADIPNATHQSSGFNGHSNDLIDATFASVKILCCKNFSAMIHLEQIIFTVLHWVLPPIILQF